MGAQLSAMAYSTPSRATRIVWFAKPWTVPLARVSMTGMIPGSRVSWLKILKISATGRPAASAWVQPVRRSATRLIRVTRASASVATTASPMELSVTASFSSLSRRTALACASCLEVSCWPASSCSVSR